MSLFKEGTYIGMYIDDMMYMSAFALSLSKIEELIYHGGLKTH